MIAVNFLCSEIVKSLQIQNAREKCFNEDRLLQKSANESCIPICAVCSGENRQSHSVILIVSKKVWYYYIAAANFQLYWW